VSTDPHLIDLLGLLVSSGISLNGIDRYQESGLRVLSQLGRFDAVRLLLDAGADESQLAWTKLIRAVALGSLADIQKGVESGEEIEKRDWSFRTAYLVAVQTGDIAKARFLLQKGAARNVCGRGGKPALFYAIENRHASMLEWLLGGGNDIEQTDDLGATPLMIAIEYLNLEAVEILLRAGADVNHEQKGRTAISRSWVDKLASHLIAAGTDPGDIVFARKRRTAINRVRDGAIARRLLAVGADPAHLSFQGQRSLLGFELEPDEALLDVSLSDFQNGCSRRFGTSNPEKIVEPFWEGMIRAGISAAARHTCAGDPHTG
jgi:hypothetical protein